MKKTINLAIAAMLCAATVTYAQTTSTSGKDDKQDKNAQGSQAASAGKSTKGSAAANAGTAASAGAGANTGTGASAGAASGTGTAASAGENRARKSTAGDGSTRPGGAEHKNANDVGRYSDTESADPKSFNSKEAIAKRKKNLTESDTTVKKGSGSAERNTKNHTGKTGNYQNRDAKQSVKSRP
ncbi:hypothetical protein MUK70_05445 [Dyadobacter chenwenxiniae]|uniref:Uncharacterized protein n=1 Tax=Dyadobacter chenwenxiniae TaxID=2906456 RepID=A0A9X1PRV1_9BACT|nr:hypothetical protein [Dyadobacter chenwenxiniae]MCF0050457.1 hypothetical protein [Dyadobacter chenwenxiniae]MCF0065299.1 hypothetical protein [Dyadobacter chenwenxiniae]UON84433.1 hypothetical protein MUK70_05445 [Dyadobacter chenwenxiniae]